MKKHKFNFSVSLQQVSREEGEETTPTTPTLQRESPDFVSLEEDTTVGERREGRLERENFRLKEQVAVKLFLVLIFLGSMRIWREKITFIWKVSICWRSLLDENRNLIRKQPGWGSLERAGRKGQKNTAIRKWGKHATSRTYIRKVKIKA